MLTEFGLWWQGEVGGAQVSFLRKHFQREEAEELLPQVASTARFCRRTNHYEVCPVTLRENTFYVTVNAEGSVYLPFLNDNKEGRTSDPTRIPVFALCYSERRRREA